MLMNVHEKGRESADTFIKHLPTNDIKSQGFQHKWTQPVSLHSFKWPAGGNSTGVRELISYRK